jgi:hypothetical protein
MSMSVVRYLVAAVSSGLLFGVLDALINTNPLARRLSEYLQPILRERALVGAGVIVDLIYGFIMSGLFLLLYKSLPGRSPLLKGLSYGAMMWFFRVGMSVASGYVMTVAPAGALFYSLAVGLMEMLLLGILYGLLLRVR